jgi:hypothetical protein
VFEGLIFRPDGSCAATTDDCPEADCASIGGIESYIADGWCDSSNNNETCDYDGGDCCESTCVDGTYDCATYGGCNGECLDPDGNDDACGGRAQTVYLKRGQEEPTTFATLQHGRTVDVICV